MKLKKTWLIPLLNILIYQKILAQNEEINNEEDLIPEAVDLDLERALGNQGNAQDPDNLLKDYNILEQFVVEFERHEFLFTEDCFCQNGGTCFKNDKDQTRCNCVDNFWHGELKTFNNVTEVGVCAFPNKCDYTANLRNSNETGLLNYSVTCKNWDHPSDPSLNVRNTKDCIPAPNGAYTCLCNEFYSGDSCEIPPHCNNTIGSNSTCQNGGSCITAIDESTGQELDTKTCSCVNGYWGPHCENNPACLAEPNPCGKNGICTNLDNGDHSCSCQNSWTGEEDDNGITRLCDVPPEGHCQIDADCKNGGTCQLHSSDAGVWRGECICVWDLETNSLFFGSTCESQNPCSDQSDDCQNGSECIAITDEASFNCECVSDYFGEKCELLHPCSSNNNEADPPCQNNGICVPTENKEDLAYTCDCINPFYGSECENDSPCNTNKPCQNKAFCVPGLEGDYSCDCDTCFNGVQEVSCEGIFWGDHCENENPCSQDPTPCLNGGTCNVGVDDVYSCTCLAGFYGQHCEEENPCLEDEPLKAVCQNGATCNIGVEEQYTCDCDAITSPTNQKFWGEHCENENPCTKNNPCLNGSTCIPGQQDEYTCDCIDEDNTDPHCQNPCDRDVFNPCLNNGICTQNTINGDEIKCTCVDNFFGDNCENAPICSISNPCGDHGDCENLPEGEHNCNCHKDWFGKSCKINPCDPDQTICQNDPNYTCNVLSKFEAECTCLNGFSGKNCEIIPACDREDPCQNGSTCVNNDDGTRKCICSDNTIWFGEFCHLNTAACTPDPCNTADCQILNNKIICDCTTVDPQPSGEYCENEHPCKDILTKDQCGDKGSCQPDGTDFICICSDHWSGEFCSVPPPCTRIDNPCNDLGICTDTGISDDDFTCQCTDNFSGPTCEIEPPCSRLEPCLNTGVCTNTGTGNNDYTCECFNFFSGNNCEILPPCESTKNGLNPCRDNGLCVNNVDTFSCTCINNFWGENCENPPGCDVEPLCQNGFCQNLIDGGRNCVCERGWYGENCDENPCLTKGCQNDHTCQIISETVAICHCDNGFTGQFCEIDQGCSRPPFCENEEQTAECINLADGTQKCICHLGWTGALCEIPEGSCDGEPCNGGVCTIVDNKVTCDCSLLDPLPTGEFCENPHPCVNELTKDQCGDNGSCEKAGTPGIDATCICKNNFHGEFCEIPPPCQRFKKLCLNDGSCTNTGINDDDYVCQCIDEFWGSRCENNPGCIANICYESGTESCVNFSEGDRQCNCKTGWSGENCEDNPCQDNNCLNESICEVISETEYRCICRLGWEGDLCEKSIACHVEPFCSENTLTCESFDDGTQECNCEPGWTGPLCDFPQDTCDSKFCNGGICSLVNGIETCQCYNLDPEPTGDNCEIQHPCINLLTKDQCGENGECLIINAEGICKCKNFHSGEFCTILPPCDRLPQPTCSGRGKCFDIGHEDSDFICQCDDQFWGARCENNPACDLNPCLYGSCSDLGNGERTCTCLEGWSGENCDQNPCQPNNCENDSTCVIISNGVYECDCQDGYTGFNCEIIPACEREPFCEIQTESCESLNNGKQVCHCKAGWTGSVCDTPEGSCTTSVCNGGSCSISQVGKINCNCNDLDPRPSGKFCQNLHPCIDDLTKNQCGDNGVCVANGKKAECQCQSFHSGEFCQISPPCERSGAPICQNNGVCQNLGTNENDFICDCIDNFWGLNCELPPACITNPCIEGSCTNLQKPNEGSRTCNCNPGWFGENCDQSPCQNNKCQNAHECKVLGEAIYECACQNGFTGEFCEIDIACQREPFCSENANTCVSLEDGTQDCICKEGFTGALCDIIEGSCDKGTPCNDGICTIVDNKINCDCSKINPLPTGDFCENPHPCIDELTRDKCGDNGHCQPDGILGNCKCVNFYSGDFCSILPPCERNANPCKNRATCTNTGTKAEDYTCDCSHGYWGENCDNEPGCVINPCKNGFCLNVKNSNGERTCDCDPGYFGIDCDINPCDSNECQNDFVCNVISDGVYECQCQNGFSGQFCEIDQSCNRPVFCISDNTELCKNVDDGTKKCICKEGWTGALCEIQEGSCEGPPDPCNGGICNIENNQVTCDCKDVQYQPTGEFCENLHPCFLEISKDQCGDNGTCKVDGIDFLCECRNNFSGKYCSIPPPCSRGENPCLENGLCEDTGSGASDYTCQCINNFWGRRCENNPGCVTSPCGSHGTCTNGANGTRFCTCEKNWFGETCQKNPCLDNQCQNDSKCKVKSSAEYKCKCDDGYSGDFCEKSEPCHLEPFCSENTISCSSEEDGKQICECKFGWTGELCDIPQGNCDGIALCSGGICTIINGKPSCDCSNLSPEPHGEFCEKDHPCIDLLTKDDCGENSKECLFDGPKALCSCKNFYSGEFCTILPPCERKENPCSRRGTCINTGTEDHEHYCVCDDNNYWGDRCENKPACVVNPCQNGICIDSGDGTRECECEMNWFGEDCDRNPCEGNDSSVILCKNGGNCQVISDGVSKCECIENFTGEFCEIEPACNREPFCKFHTDFCENLPSGHQNCHCHENWTGALCDKPEGSCENDPCNGGICTVDNGKVQCSCRDLFPRPTGNFCENPHPCERDVTSDKCGENGTCKIDGTFGICECTDNYSGEFCSILPPCSRAVNPCQNEGLCTDTGTESSDFTCQCQNNYWGDKCENEPGCETNPCLNGSCTNVFQDDYTCTCEPDWFGRNCDMNPCLDNACQNLHTCVAIQQNTYRCSCDLGYTGEFCEIDLGCHRGPFCSENTQTCESLVDGNKICICKNGWTGALCEIPEGSCDGDPCHGGSCQVIDNKVTCDCSAVDPLPTGNFCENKHPCVADLTKDQCGDHGRCKIDGSDSFCKCHKKDLYSGQFCSIPPPCERLNPCENGGTCKNKGTDESDYKCICPNGFYGTNCEKRTGCSMNPCVNGICTNVNDGDRICNCSPNWFGEDCDFHPCQDNTCVNESTCQILSASSYECVCPPGKSGEFCEINEPCHIAPFCNNQNTQSCETNIQNGNQECSCHPEWTGDLCEVERVDCDPQICNGGICSVLNGIETCDCSNFNLHPTGLNCENQHPCLVDANLCGDHGTCTANSIDPTLATCDCELYYTGINCEIDPPCSRNPKPCENGAICSNLLIDGNLDYSCECQNFYYGKSCENIPACDIVPAMCVNGICSNQKNGGHSCECSENWFGKNCDRNPCKNHGCQNNSECVVISNGVYECDCLSGYTGEKCEFDLACNREPFCDPDNTIICDNLDSGYQICHCKDDWTGALCDQPDGSCNNDLCNGGICTVLAGKTNCDCSAISPLPTGKFCENEHPCKDERTENRCGDYGNCLESSENPAEAICSCEDHYSGDYCGILPPCQRNGNPCEHDGICTNMGTDELDYFCTCKNFHWGANCEHDPGCIASPCINGECTNFKNGLRECICQEGWFGEDCSRNPCSDNNCQNVSNCKVVADGIYNCECLNGYTGEFCELDLACHRGPFCGINTVECQSLESGNQNCICENGWTGALCEVPEGSCDDDPCNGGTCTLVDNKIACDCSQINPLPTGEFCQFPHPCVDELTKDQCGEFGTCKERGENHFCECDDHYSGEYCSILPPCQRFGVNNSPCIKGECTNVGLASTDFTCDCPQFYWGENCENQPGCIINPCTNGVCIDGAFSTRVCECEEDWYGRDCSYNPCVGNLCQNANTCKVYSKNIYFCVCENNYTGEYCEIEPGCERDPFCHADNTESCESFKNGFKKCHCKEGWTGELCDINIVSCLPDPCNGAECSINNNEIVCDCTTVVPQPTGEFCQNLHPCFDDLTKDRCGEQGKCIADGASSSCVCEKFYSGEYCSILPPCERIGDRDTRDVCSGQGICLNTGTEEDEYVCKCQNDYWGDNCENLPGCISTPCGEFGVCTNQANGQRNCECLENWFGEDCDKNPCQAAISCQHDFTCGVIVENVYECLCDNGYTGEFCQIIPSCQRWPFCGSTTTKACDSLNDGNQNCICDDGWTGALCEFREGTCDAIDNPCNEGVCSIDEENEIVECDCSALDPEPSGEFCENKHICYDDLTKYQCGEYGKCKEQGPAAVCKCKDFWSGEYCSIPPPCSRNGENPCLNDGICTNRGTEINDYTCQCSEQFFGSNCQVNPCDDNQCQNTFTCNVLSEGVAQCICHNYFSGEFCQIDPACDRPDFCDPVNTDSCENLDDGNKKCHCKNGWHGALCKIDTVSCDPNPCHGGLCSIVDEKIICDCSVLANPSTGDFCENLHPCSDPLTKDQCGQHGTCQVLGTIALCECNDFYSGEFCSIPPPCNRYRRSKTCSNNGICTNTGIGTSDYICECDDFYWGDQCENLPGCELNSCGDHATCENALNGERVCKCDQDWFGFDCDRNPCLEHDLGCQNDASCKVVDDGVAQCICSDGYTGEFCHIEPACNRSPFCEDHTLSCDSLDDGTQICNCEPGWFGDLCQLNEVSCDPNPCNGGDCSLDIVNNLIICDCSVVNPQPTGEYCQHPHPCVDELTKDQCNENGRCEVRGTGAVCECENFYSGEFCSIPPICSRTQASPCLNGGICRDFDTDVFDCECPEFYCGTICQEEPACDNNPCGEYGTCSNTNKCAPKKNLYQCDCEPNWFGINCDSNPCKDKNGKLDHDCQHGGVCTVINEFSYGCSCPLFYTGQFCQHLPACERDPKCGQHTEACQNHNDGTKTCICEQNWTGAYCEIEGVTCDGDPCRGGTCSIEFGKIVCDCTNLDPQPSGIFCQNEHPCVAELTKNQCGTNGKCVVVGQGALCDCDSFYSGPFCEIAPPCERSEDGTNPCKNNGACSNLDTANYSCSCSDFYYGDVCEIPPGCEVSNNCVNGQCINEGEGSISCQCDNGWMGELCSEPIPGSCQSEHNCKNGSVCIDDFSRGTYNCQCPNEFYSGIYCENLPPCQAGDGTNMISVCQNSASCINLSQTEYQCECLPGYSGLNCDIIPACQREPFCTGLGVQSSECISHNDGTKTCVCIEGWAGATCDVSDSVCEPTTCNGGICSIDPDTNKVFCECDSIVPRPTGKFCENKHPCFSSDLCSDVHGTCEVEGIGFRCDCLDFYSGRYCNVPPPCQRNGNPCKNDAICINENESSFICNCPIIAGNSFYGNNCENPYPCNGNPCQNGGTCRNDLVELDDQLDITRYQVTCMCNNFYFGEFCEEQPYCTQQPDICGDNGACINKLNGEYECSCDGNWYGKNCDKINPCLHPDNKNICNNHGLCQNLVSISNDQNNLDDISCSCQDYWWGDRCENPPVCDTSNHGCLNGICENVIPTGNDVFRYRCTCDGLNYHFGELCFSTPCDEGLCNVDGTQRCINKSDQTGNNGNGLGYECLCHDWAYGIHCENSLPCDKLENVNYCGPHGTCINTYVNDIPQLTCRCETFWEGFRCERSTRPCDRSENLNYCGQHGTCTDTDLDNDGKPDLKCICDDSWHGDKCSWTSNPCEQIHNFNYCGSNGRCKNQDIDGDGIPEPICTCQNNYSGVRCERQPPPTPDPVPISACINNRCNDLHTSFCQEINGAAYCKCKEGSGYYGTFCNEYDPCQDKIKGLACFNNGGICEINDDFRRSEDGWFCNCSILGERFSGRFCNETSKLDSPTLTVTDSSSSSGLSGGAIAGIVIGTLLGCCCCCWLFFIGWRRYKRKHKGDYLVNGDKQD